MLNILITIKEQNNQILAHIRNTQQARSVVTFTLPENLPLHLPLKTSEDVNLLEEYINDETNCSNLVNIEYIFSLFFYVCVRIYFILYIICAFYVLMLNYF